MCEKFICQHVAIYFHVFSSHPPFNVIKLKNRLFTHVGVPTIIYSHQLVSNHIKKTRKKKIKLSQSVKSFQISSLNCTRQLRYRVTEKCFRRKIQKFINSTKTLLTITVTDVENYLPQIA